MSVANEANVDQLMRTATDLVAGRDAEILVMHAVDLPNQTPYAEGRGRVEEERSVVDRAMDVAEDAGVPVSGTIRLTHDPADAILNTVEQYDAEGVLMGWGGRRSRRRDIAVGSTVDDVATEVDADVFVEKVGKGEGEADGEVDSVLLPWTGGTHADLAAETAAAIARTTGASIDVVHVLEPGEDRAEAEQRLADAEERLAEQNAAFEDVDIEFETRIVEGDDVEEALVEEADGHEVVTIAAEKEGILQRFVFGSLPESVGDQVETTSIMCKRNVGAPSRLKRLLS